MTKRSRCIAGLAFGFMGGAICLAALVSSRERADVELLLIGYTNVPARNWNCQDVHVRTVLFRKPILLVTNCGSVSVQLLSICDPRVRTNTANHLHSYLRVKSFELKPGESTQAELLPLGQRDIHRAVLAYQRLDLAHRLSQRARSSTNAVMRSVAKLLPRPPKPHWVHSEPLTNLVTYRSRDQAIDQSLTVSYDLLAPPTFYWIPGQSAP